MPTGRLTAHPPQVTAVPPDPTRHGDRHAILTAGVPVTVAVGQRGWACSSRAVWPDDRRNGARCGFVGLAGATVMFCLSLTRRCCPGVTCSKS
jgi:hypothetical protein